MQFWHRLDEPNIHQRPMNWWTTLPAEEQAICINMTESCRYAVSDTQDNVCRFVATNHRPVTHHTQVVGGVDQNFIMEKIMNEEANVVTETSIHGDDDGNKEQKVEDMSNSNDDANADGDQCDVQVGCDDETIHVCIALSLTVCHSFIVPLLYCRLMM